MAKIDACCDPNNKVEERQSFWNDGFTPVRCENIGEFDTYMGHEIALEIKAARDRSEKIAFILPVGPMGMYKWAVYFLKEWKVYQQQQKERQTRRSCRQACQQGPGGRTRRH